jgi:hypothetical protein
MLRDSLFVVRKHMQNMPRILVHGSFPASQVEKDFRFSIPNAVMSSRSMVHDPLGIWA